jgi:hypothetical protein
MYCGVSDGNPETFDQRVYIDLIIVDVGRNAERTSTQRNRYACMLQLSVQCLKIQT